MEIIAKTNEGFLITAKNNEIEGILSATSRRITIKLTRPIRPKQKGKEMICLIERIVVKHINEK